mmetsp:Transcript_25643/g.22775  ORF Transcript_25643/g.22775 Transcript_25643/m.22775 type:complete len:109 (+) Transcript_25643:182-508(+)
MNSSKNIAVLKPLMKKQDLRIVYKQKRAFSNHSNDIFTTITGIDEVRQEDEQSPEPGRKKVLPSIKEETKGYYFPNKYEKEEKINEFLEDIKIYQVFPSEINLIKLSY